MKRRNGGALSSAVFGTAAGAGGSLFVTLILTALGADLINRGTVSASVMDGLALGILIMSTIIGTLLAVGMTGNQRLAVGVGAGVVYFVTLLGCSAMLFDGAYSGVGVTVLVILGGSLGAVLLSVNIGRNVPGKKRSKNRTSHAHLR